MERFYLCGGDDFPGPRDECPHSLHDWPLPSGYNDAHTVGHQRLYRKWTQKRCPLCHLYGWIPGRLLEGEKPVSARPGDE